MNALIRKVALATAFLITLPAAQAAIQNYSFSGKLDSGVYVGETFSGSFSFNDDAIINSNSEWLSVDTLNMTFLGYSFTLAQAIAPVEVGYSNGAFLGLSFSADSDSFGFTLTPGDSHLSQAFLAYDSNVGLSGTGDVIYAAVPEPETYALLLAGLAVMGGVARRRKLNQTNH